LFPAVLSVSVLLSSLLAEARLLLNDFRAVPKFAFPSSELFFSAGGGGGGTRCTAGDATAEGGGGGGIGAVGKGRAENTVDVDGATDEATLTSSSPLARRFLADFREEALGAVPETTLEAGSGVETASFSRKVCTILLPRRKLSRLRPLLVFEAAVPSVPRLITLLASPSISLSVVITSALLYTLPVALSVRVSNCCEELKFIGTIFVAGTSGSS
jgi:hypothetical protein